MPDMGDAGYAMETQIYIIDMKEYKTKTNSWEELNAQIYNLCLQHCPPVLELVLKANSRWEKISCDQNGIGLLLVIRDITHKQDENMQSTMSYVEAFLELSTTFQSTKQTNKSYYER